MPNQPNDTQPYQYPTNIGGGSSGFDALMNYLAATPDEWSAGMAPPPQPSPPGVGYAGQMAGQQGDARTMGFAGDASHNLMMALAAAVMGSMGKGATATQAGNQTTVSDKTTKLKKIKSK